MKLRSVVLAAALLAAALAFSATSLAQEEKKDDTGASPAPPGTPAPAGSGPITTGGPLGCQSYGALNVPQAIPDVSTINNTLSVAQPFAIADVNVTLNISHTFDGDLDILLISPANTTVDLTSDNGGGGDNYAGTTFDDEAATAITAGVAPFTGTFRPEAPLSAFDSQLANGTWTLRVTDDAGADIGTLNSWTLNLCANVANDAFGGAIAISALPFTDGQITAGATTAGNDPVITGGCGGPSVPTNSNSVWYSYTPPANTLLRLSTVGSLYDTVITVFTGTKGALQQVACDDQGGGLGTSLIPALYMEAGTTYYIEVTDWNVPSGGALVINLDTPPLNVDYDLDGCMSDRELGANAAQGGGRNPTNFWDFYDTPGPGNVRDRAITAGDLARVVERFGSSGNKATDPLSAPPPPIAYHPAFDRTPPGVSPNGIEQSANGSVTAQDLAVIVSQFGHTCA
jgi:subtilisin-like proprotein convertase family protein